MMNSELNISDPVENVEPLDEDDDEDPITSKKLLESLENAWLNEKFAPEILPHQTDVLDLMLGQIVHMDENIGQLKRHDFRLIAHKMELARIRYIISSYLRCRLEKIERYAVDILSKEEKRSEDQKKLSPQEHAYAESFVSNMNEHFHRVALRHMPSNLQEATENQVVQPNVNEHVFLKANVSVSSVVIGRIDEEVDLLEGSRHVMPYNLAAELVLDGRVQLI